jgi:hypothetical protein
MKTIFRFIVGYLIGTLIVVIMSLQQGDFLDAVLQSLITCLPISGIIAAVTILILKISKVACLLGMMELCGLCVGLFSDMPSLCPIGFLLIVEVGVLLIVISMRVLVFGIFHK